MRTEIFAVFVFQVRVCERVTEKDRYIERERKRERGRNTKLQCFTLFELSFSRGTVSLISNKLNITENLKSSTV